MDLISSPSPTVRFRALALVMSLAGASPEAAAVVRQKGQHLVKVCRYTLKGVFDPPADC